MAGTRPTTVVAMAKPHMPDSLRAASAALVLAVQRHTSAVLAAGDDLEAVGIAAAELGAALRSYEQAQNRLTDDGDAVDPEDASVPGLVISVVRRHDYVVYAQSDVWG